MKIVLLIHDLKAMNEITVKPPWTRLVFID